MGNPRYIKRPSQILLMACYTVDSNVFLVMAGNACIHTHLNRPIPKRTDAIGYLRVAFTAVDLADGYMSAVGEKHVFAGGCNPMPRNVPITICKGHKAGKLRFRGIGVRVVLIGLGRMAAETDELTGQTGKSLRIDELVTILTGNTLDFFEVNLVIEGYGLGWQQSSGTYECAQNHGYHQHDDNTFG